MEPGLVRNCEQLQEPALRSARGFVLTADNAGCQEVSSVLVQGGSPEAVLEYLLGELSARVSGKIGVMGPFQDVGSQGFGSQGLAKKQAMWQNGTGTWLVKGGEPHYLLNATVKKAKDAGRRQNGN